MYTGSRWEAVKGGLGGNPDTDRVFSAAHKLAVIAQEAFASKDGLRNDLTLVCGREVNCNTERVEDTRTFAADTLS